MSYVDGMVAAAPANGKDAYLEYAQRAAEVFKSLGATSVVDCWGETVPNGEVTSFPMAVKKKEDEVVVFSWIEWPDKATRDAGAEKVMKDERMQPKEGEDMPFTGARLIYGGFEVLLDAKA